MKPFDWSYTTDYKGTVTGTDFEATSEVIPIELLKRPDPILFYEEVVLYESELDDNGISMFSIKVRVMPERMLLLCRLFMRLDNVIFRIRDTRVYVDFRKKKIIREYTALEDTWAKVKEVSTKDLKVVKCLVDHNLRIYSAPGSFLMIFPWPCGIQTRSWVSCHKSVIH